MIQAKYAGEAEYNNTKGIFVDLVFSGFYGVAGVGDLLNLAPYEQSANPGGITDAGAAYNNILATPPSTIGPQNTDLGGYYVAVHKPAAPTLYDIGLLMYAPGGAELNSNQAYPAAVLAGTVKLFIAIPALQ